MKVYRLENKDGDGPYNRGNPIAQKLYHAHSGDIENHPTPYRDDLFSWMNSNRDWKCGCVSMQQLYQWFGGFIKPLMNLGYKIVVINVPKSRVKVGRRQLVFRKQP